MKHLQLEKIKFEPSKNVDDFYVTWQPFIDLFKKGEYQFSYVVFFSLICVCLVFRRDLYLYSLDKCNKKRVLGQRMNSMKNHSCNPNGKCA